VTRFSTLMIFIALATGCGHVATVAEQRDAYACWAKADPKSANRDFWNDACLEDYWRAVEELRSSVCESDSDCGLMFLPSPLEGAFVAASKKKVDNDYRQVEDEVHKNCGYIDMYISKRPTPHCIDGHCALRGDPDLSKFPSCKP